MEAGTVRRLSFMEELKLAEAQTPGHKASRGPGDTIILTPVPEHIETDRDRRARIARGVGQTTELSRLMEVID